MNARELWKYLDALNEKNDFDLRWEWCGEGEIPQIRVYEENDGHDLTGGNMANIKERIQKALPSWNLEDV